MVVWILIITFGWPHPVPLKMGPFPTAESCIRAGNALLHKTDQTAHGALCLGVPKGVS
jgi:hypothetical protein